MKMTIRKFIGGFALTACMAFVLTNCQKDQNTDAENNFSEFQSETNAEDRDAAPNPLGCEDDIPAILNVPEGNKLAFRVYATGVQIYEVKQSPTNPNAFLWVNTAPSANLYSQLSYNNLVGTHYAGPSWEFIKGPFKNEKAVATKLEGSVVDPTAVPWLLLKTVENLSSPGNKITYIQRVCTTGGLAPTTIPSAANLGQVENVPYTATYLFYKKVN